MIHINKFLDKLKLLEAKRSRDFIMTTAEAKALHTDITKLLLAVVELQNTPTPTANTETTVELKGDDW